VAVTSIFPAAFDSGCAVFAWSCAGERNVTLFFFFFFPFFFFFFFLSTYSMAVAGVEITFQ
jgi:hypothetical protein